MSIKNFLQKITRIEDEGIRTSYFKSLRPAVKSARGLSLVEVVVVIFVVSAVAFLAAPIVFPGDSKTADAQVRSDIDLLKQVMDLRMTSYDAAKTGGLGVEANIGVYAAYAQFEGKATLDANGKPAFYCLKGTHPSGLVLYYTSKDGAVMPTPIDATGCPGGVPTGGNQNGATPAPSVEPSAPAENAPNPLPSQSGQPAPTPIPTTQSGANN
jgi:type II secretory pathway pseudopilin PulG